MGLYDKIGEAKFSEGGNYLQEGVFRLEVIKITSKTTRKGQPAYIVEFRVHESDNPKHRVGSDVTWMVTLDKEPALGNIKQFIASVMAADMDEVTSAVAEMTCSDDQPLTGKFVRASAVNIKTKRNTDFTKVKFYTDADGAASVAAAHAKNAA